MALAMNVFKRSIEENIQDYLPREYEDAEIYFSEIRKNNIQATGLIVKLPDRQAAPIINLDMFLERPSRNGASFNERGIKNDNQN